MGEKVSYGFAVKISNHFYASGTIKAAVKERLYKLHKPLQIKRVMLEYLNQASHLITLLVNAKI